MNWKTLSICLALGTSALAAGCGGDTTPPPVESTHSYILSGGDIPMPTSDGFAVGFNLDDMVNDGLGDGCVGEAADFTSSISGAEGVDNQLAGVVGLLAGELEGGVAGALRDQIAAGSFLLVMEVTSNGIVNDSTAEVHLFLANSPGAMCDNAGMTCPANSICPEDATAAEPAHCGPTTDADGVIVGGQTYTMAMNIATVPATITSGHLLIDVDSLPLSLVIGGDTLSLELLRASIGGDLTATEISNGEIGAEVTVMNILDVAAVAGFDITEDLIRTVAHPDLDPRADGVDCDSISAGLSFSAVSANPD